MPSRLLDLGENAENPRLVESAELPFVDRFVFFSCSWDKDTSALQATMENYQQLKRGISLTVFPELLRDAILLCHRLKYRYIFLNVLCIIAEDEQDWLREVSRIGLYIASAELVLAATGTSIKNIAVSQLEPIKLSAHFDDEDHGRFELMVRNTMPTPAAEVQNHIVNDAWRLQEAFLASRLVVFGPDHISWSCSTMQQSESSASSLPPMPENLQNLNSWVQQHSGNSPTSKVRDFIFLRWYSIIRILSQAPIRFIADRLFTVAGIMSAIESLLDEKDGIVAGVIKSDLAHGLLWVGDQRIEDEDHSRGIPNAVPSWSWASNEGPVSYDFAPGLKIRGPGTETLELSCLEANGGKTGEFAKEAYLVVSALTMPGSNENVVATFEYFWDKCGTPDLWNEGLATVLSSCHLALCAPWTFHSGSSKKAAQWLGLILEQIEEGVFKRLGVFMGPSTDSSLDGWEKTTMTLR